MTKFGPYVIGASNNWRRLHGIPMQSTKRYRNERKDMPKKARVRYHTMKEAGCDDELIAKYLLRCDGFVLN